MTVKFIVEHEEKDKDEVLARLKVERKSILKMKKRFKVITEGRMKKMTKKKLGKKGITNEEVEDTAKTLHKDYTVEIKEGDGKSALVVSDHPFFDYEEGEELIIRIFYETITSPFLSKFKGLKRKLSLAKSKKFRTWLEAKMSNTLDIVEDEEKPSFKKEIAEENRESLEEALQEKDGIDAEVSYELC